MTYLPVINKKLHYLDPDPIELNINSPFISFSKLKKIKSRNLSKLNETVSIVSFNVNGLSSIVHKFRTDFIQIVNQNDLVVFLETHVSDGEKICEVPGYGMLMKNRRDIGGGGIAIFYSKLMAVKEVKASCQDILCLRISAGQWKVLF